MEGTTTMSTKDFLELKRYKEQFLLLCKDETVIKCEGLRVNSLLFRAYHNQFIYTGKDVVIENLTKELNDGNRNYFDLTSRYEKESELRFDLEKEVEIIKGKWYYKLFNHKSK